MARLSTLGVTFGYGIETTAGTKPASFTQLELASSIGGISLDTEQIDVSALADRILVVHGKWNLSWIRTSP